MSELSKLLTQANVDGLSAEKIEKLAKARGVKLSHGTANKYMKGEHPQVPNREILRAFTVVFPSLNLDTLERVAKLPLDRGPYVPPGEANSLDDQERAALTLIIKSMAAGKSPADAQSSPGKQSAPVLDLAEHRRAPRQAARDETTKRPTRSTEFPENPS